MALVRLALGCNMLLLLYGEGYLCKWDVCSVLTKKAHCDSYNLLFILLFVAVLDDVEITLLK
jgi:hypothetical protein